MGVSIARLGLTTDVFCLQSSFTPFLTENIYQGLRQFFPKSIPKELGHDLRSVHFLRFPTVRQDYFDVVIERRVKRMQAVINLGRLVRERKTLAVKVRAGKLFGGIQANEIQQQPLAEIVVFHSDPEYLKDVRSLQQYIEEELNVHKVTYTSDEAFCGVKYTVTADWPVLGKRLRKDMGKVRAALPKVTSEEVKDFIKSGKITVAGIELSTGDLVGRRYVELPEPGPEVNGQDGGPSYEAATDEDVVILLDCRLRRGLELEGFARELMNRVQKLRKKAGLVQTDEIQVYYGFGDDASAESKKLFEEVVEEKAEVILRVLKRHPLPVAQRKSDQQVIIEEEQEKWGDQRVTFALVHC